MWSENEKVFVKNLHFSNFVAFSQYLNLNIKSQNWRIILHFDIKTPLKQRRVQSDEFRSIPELLKSHQILNKKILQISSELLLLCHKKYVSSALLCGPSHKRDSYFLVINLHVPRINQKSREVGTRFSCKANANHVWLLAFVILWFRFDDLIPFLKSCFRIVSCTKTWQNS